MEATLMLFGAANHLGWVRSANDDLRLALDMVELARGRLLAESQNLSEEVSSQERS
jgi:hypothetical protein